MSPRTAGEHATMGSQESDQSRPAKRARVAVACTRCKTRKQKCDGRQPSCGNCKSVSAPCEYIVPSRTLPYGKYQYVRALEERVAELELLLADSGMPDPGRDHWKKLLGSDIFKEINPPLGSSLNQNALGIRTMRLLVTPDSGSEFPQESNERESPGLQFYKDFPTSGSESHVGDAPPCSTHENATNINTRCTKLAAPSSNSSPHSNPNLLSVDITGLPESGYGRSELMSIPDETAERLLRSYLKHISTRWLVLHRPQVISLHKKRMNLTTPFEISILNLIYAIAGRFLETSGESSLVVTSRFDPELHYSLSLAYFNHFMQTHDLAAVQNLLLHGIYCLRAPRGQSAWTYAGHAIRICIELGMHRNQSSKSDRPSLAIEIRKRLFWSCYCLDRQVSIILGRPFAISDRDIDAELPLDIDDSATDEEIASLVSQSPSAGPLPSTSLSCFIHLTRLRRIESQIQQSIYRVDVDKASLLPTPIIERFLLSLSTWKEQIRADFVAENADVYSYDGIHFFMVYYYKTLRLLLYPQLTRETVDMDIAKMCAEACGGVCRTYKNLHRKTAVGFSLMALHSIFLAGLTLLYCIWLSPSKIYTISASNDLNACSIVLYVITERWPRAKKYRDAFESIKQCILELVEDGGGERGFLQRLSDDEELREVVKGVRGLHPEGRAEFSKMMSEMVGEVPAPRATSEVKFKASNNGSLSIEVPNGNQQQHYTEGNSYGSGSGMAYNGMQIETNAFGVQAIGDMAMGMGYDGELPAELLDMELLDEFDMSEFNQNVV